MNWVEWFYTKIGEVYIMLLITNMGNVTGMVDSTLALIATLTLLSLYSVLDVRDRKVPNQVMLIGGIVGAAVTIISGRAYENLPVYIFALVFGILISYILFRLCAFGGADAKALITVAIISPGVEFANWNAPLIEAIIATGIETAIMLALGYLYWYQKKKSDIEALAPPLIPLLLVGYLVVQVLALI